MRRKDLEQKIRSAKDDVKVPDVYAAVKKKTRIRKLADGQTPVSAFRKRLAIALLSITLIIFIVLAVVLYAFSVRGTSPAPEIYGYTSVTLRADEHETRMGLVSDAEGKVIFAADEIADTPLDICGSGIAECIALLIGKTADNGAADLDVKVKVYRESSTEAAKARADIAGFIDDFDGYNISNMEISIAKSADKDAFVQYILSFCPSPSVTASASISDLCIAYMQVF